MNNKGQESVIISFFIAAMVALIIVVVAGDFVTDQNTIQSDLENNLSTSSNGTSFTALKRVDLVSDSETVWNMSGLGEELTKDTDYVINYEKGQINVTVISQVNILDTVIVNITYDYFPAGYTKSNLNRTMVLLIPVFIIISLLLVLVIPITKGS